MYVLCSEKLEDLTQIADRKYYWYYDIDDLENST